ncbi:MAG: hypothetical protein LBV17_04685 [Treponema sp.]|jgi:hypothetical protein|nr:hypothetical protein [Treponema sp.]
MGKKTIIFCLLLTLSFGAVWAAGRKQNESKTAEDPAAFKDVIDSTEKKPGKWNYYLEATDRANNVSRAGPDNMFIDPASDLPKTTIINPLPNMRVQGNLNIVGIAMDDDGVKSVWLTVTRGKDGKGEELVNVQADGADYWSYYLDTTNTEIWTDGVYTITTWAIDINDLSGISDSFPAKSHRKHSIYWNLDRKKPNILITSHEVGALVAGNVRLKGTIADGNGINAISYSLDEGVKYQPLKPSYDKKNDLYDWELNLNSKTFEDGPKVIWFRGQDGQGSVGVNAHLLYINNTPPDVSIVFPEPTATVCGVFSIAGYAKHRVGLSSLSWKAGGKEGGTIPILPGNPWWSADVNIRELKTSSIDIEVRAVDVSGNVTVYKQKFKVDQNADMPTITLTDPSAGAITDNKGNLVVKGTAVDNDGVSSVFYSIGPNQAVEVKTSGYFQFVIPGIPEGTYNLDIWAKDITGVLGPKVQVKGITVPAALLQPGISSVITGNRPEKFYTGMRIPLEPKIKKTMEVEIKGLSQIANATISFADGPADAIKPVAGKDMVSRAVVTIPPSLPSGYTKIEIRVTDRAGREVVFPEYVFIEQNDPAVPENPDARRGQWLDWVRPVIGASGRMVLSSKDDVLLGLANEPLERSRLRLNGVGSENLTLDVDEYGRVQLKALREGSFGPLTLLLGTFNSQQFNVIADFNGPVITVKETPKDWVTTSIPFKINVTSVHRVNSIAYSVDMGGNWQPLLSASEAAALGAPVNTDISRTINVTNIQDGSINIMIRAINDAGNESVANFTAYKDTIAPEAELIMPLAEARVNGVQRLGFAIKEAGALKTVTYNRPSSAGVNALTVEVFNAEKWDKEYAPVFLEVQMDPIKMPLNSRMRFIFEDMAGNRSETNTWQFVIDPEYGVPVVQIVLPQDNEVITTDFVASGVMFDDDEVSHIFWRLDNGQEKRVDAKYGFSIPITLSSLTDNEHSVTVTAEDIYGVKSMPVTRKFRVSLAEPTARVTFPRFDSVLRDVIQITGTAADKNGIKEIFISADNGNTYNKAQGTESWAYRFNSRILKDGPHVVFIRVVDNYDIPATYASMINIDNTDPELVLDSPADGSLSIGRLAIMGRVIDPNLDNVSIEIRSLEGANVNANVKSRKLGSSDTIKQDYELTGMRDGLYNIEIVSTDKAGNVSRNSRNFALARETYKNIVEIYYPLDNEHVQGNFKLYGYAGGTDAAGKVTVKVNNIDKASAEVDPVSGFYTILLSTDELVEGNNTVVVYSDFGGYGTVQSRAQNLVYAPYGPWVTIDSFKFGEFAYERPYVTGRYGYTLSAEDQELLAAKETDKEIKDAIKLKVPSYVEISFDNGKNFIKTSKALAKNVNYRYRLETGDMYEGIHYILLRATMKNGETALTRLLVQVDKTPPVIRLISPEAGSVYNQTIMYSASASDDVELVSLTYHLRKGDKAAYEIPGFLQGMYIEGIIPPFLKQMFNGLPNMPFGGGATYTDFGLGLSFFDDNVKVQLQYGFMTQDLYEALGGSPPPLGVRYGGHVIALKLIPSLYTLPLGSLWGPDFDWLFASFAIGANFSMFDVAQEGYTQSGKATFMSALLFQIEFPKVTIPKRKNLRTFSLFTEGQLWFVPTDADAEKLGIEIVIPHIIMGLRIYIF